MTLPVMLCDAGPNATPVAEIRAARVLAVATTHLIVLDQRMRDLTQTVERFSFSLSELIRDLRVAPQAKRERTAQLQAMAERSVVRFGMFSDPRAYHRFGANPQRLARSNPPKRFSFYQGDF